MKELLTQVKNKCPFCENLIGYHLVPWTEDDLEKLKEFKVNQPLKTKLYGAEKERSYQQLKMYWSLCKFVAQQMSDHEKQYSKEDIDFHVKVRVAKGNPSLIKRFKMVDGLVYLQPISIAFRNMKHLTACRFFDLAFPIMAGMIGCTTEELLANQET